MEAKEIEINEIEKLDSVLEDINLEIRNVKSRNSNSETGRWKRYYRGEAKQYDEVNASIFRDDFLFANEGKYLNFLAKKTGLGQTLKDLGKIQHYGGCSRLMDFTKDFNVALYFACCEHDDEDGYIYCYETESIDDESSATCKIIADFTFSEEEDLHNTLQRLAENYKKEVDKIVEILRKDYFLDFDLLKDKNLRMNRQDGLFLWMGDTQLTSNNVKKGKATPLSDKNGRGEEYPGVVLKVTIKNHVKKDIRSYLEQPRTYTKGYLFPDEPKGTGYKFSSIERKFFENIINGQNLTN